MLLTFFFIVMSQNKINNTFVTQVKLGTGLVALQIIGMTRHT